jgi:hypothetical protein
MELSGAVRRYGLAALLTTAFSISTPMAAQPYVRVEIAGAAFNVEKGQASHIDSPKSRKFTGQGGTTIIVKGPLWIPPAIQAYPKLQRLVVHFKSDQFGADFVAVEVWNGTRKEFRVDNAIRGDYSTRDIDKPATSANMWLVPSTSVDAHTIVRLVISFPGGFEGPVGPTDFFLAGVGADFAAKPVVSKTIPHDLLL